MVPAHDSGFNANESSSLLNYDEISRQALARRAWKLQLSLHAAAHGSLSHRSLALLQLNFQEHRSSVSA